MDFLISPNVAYLLIFAAVMLAISSILYPKSNIPKILLVVCLAAAGFELTRLQANPWALLATALSPLPFFIMFQLERQHLSLLGLTVVLLTIASVLIFVDKNGHPLVNLGLAGVMALFSSQYLLFISQRRRQNARGSRLNQATDSVIGMVGEVLTEIDTLGSVKIDGELWLARSERSVPIPVGSLVRVTRCDGHVVVVKKVENPRPDVPMRG